MIGIYKFGSLLAIAHVCELVAIKINTVWMHRVWRSLKIALLLFMYILCVVGCVSDIFEEGMKHRGLPILMLLVTCYLGVKINDEMDMELFDAAFYAQGAPPA